MHDTIFGTPEQVNVVRRAYALRELLRDDTRMSFQGRTVSLAEEQDNTSDIVIALARLQGYSSCHFIRKPAAAACLEDYQAAGLTPTLWNQFWGRDSALVKSRDFLSDYTPPPGLKLKTVDPQTPEETIRAIGEMSMQAGVLPPPGSAMRGVSLDGIYAYVEASNGAVVAAGGAFMAYHRDGPRGDEAFWGMLATDSEHRGKRLACWVGAQIILDMAERFGARGFSSGVKPDNPASQAMCSRVGVGPSEFHYAGATDAAVMGGVSVTR